MLRTFEYHTRFSFMTNMPILFCLKLLKCALYFIPFLKQFTKCLNFKFLYTQLKITKFEYTASNLAFRKYTIL